MEVDEWDDGGCGEEGGESELEPADDDPMVEPEMEVKDINL